MTIALKIILLALLRKKSSRSRVNVYNAKKKSNEADDEGLILHTE